jgi:DNA-nicking Smr family endonuclease
MTAKGNADPPHGPKNLKSEDLKLWRRVTEEARPLRRRAPALPSARAPASPQVEPPGIGKSAPPAATRETLPPKTTRALPTLSSHGRAAGLDKATAEKLRRGLLPVEARLDLHGHTQEAAHRALAAFVVRAAGEGKRCLLVITGKGNAPGSEGVLRRSAPLWLNEAPLRAHILAFAEAQARHGGGGALYILLKRQR